jgi:hypothetical protein
MLAISVTLDGTEIPPAWVSTMFQVDPFPGGHRYALSLDAPKALIDVLGPNLDLVNPSIELAAQVLQRMTRLLRQGAASPPRYLLNSIERLTVSESKHVSLHGVCSPWLPIRP